MASRDIIGPQDRFERMGAQRLRDIRPFSTRLWGVLMSEASALFLSGAAIAMFEELAKYAPLLPAESVPVSKTVLLLLVSTIGTVPVGAMPSVPKTDADRL